MRGALALTLACFFGRGIGSSCKNASDIAVSLLQKSAGRVVPSVLAESSSDAMLAKTLARMTYWHAGEKPLPSTRSYVLFSGDAGGPNNMRIGWEMTGLIAQASNRTLVLPPAWHMYLLDFGPGRQRLPHEMDGKETMTAAEDLINLQQLKASLPTLTADEFAKEAGVSWDHAKDASVRVGTNNACKYSAYQGLSDRFVFLDGEAREGFSCGDWSMRGGPTDQLKLFNHVGDRDWSLLTHGFVWHKDAFDIAARVVSFLGIFEYNALHARYNDFQYTNERQGASTIWGKWESVFKSAPKMYVASDEPEKIKKLKEVEGIELYTFDDMLNTVLKDVKPLYSAERWFKLTGPVEELICTYAKTFVGTKSSSFSGHIDRMRIHAQAPVTRMLTHTNPVELREITPDIKAWEQNNGKLRITRSSPHQGDAFLLQTEASSVSK